MHRSILLAFVIGLLASGCRDFAIPESMSAEAVENLEVTPLRVGRGGRLSIAFELRSGAAVEVTVNGLSASLDRYEGSRQVWGYSVVGDEGELLNVVVTAVQGASRASASAQAYLDTAAPLPPDPALLVLESGSPGHSDLLSGRAGCVQGSDVHRVEVALDAAGRLLVATAPVAADGSFAALDLGDNAVGRLFVFALDEVGNRSPPTAAENDLEGPGILSLDFSPRSLRSGRPVRAQMRFNEELAGVPSATFAAGATEQTLEVSVVEGGLWQAVAQAIELPEGSATLRIGATDRSGNRSESSYPLSIASVTPLDEAAVRLFRSEAVPAGWRVEGAVGAAPFPSRLEISLVTATQSRVCGSRLVASDGSFEEVYVAPQLSATDEVTLKVFDDSGGEIGGLALSSDMQPPQVLDVQITPPVLGPSAPATITITADEAIGEASTVTVDDRPAQRLPD
ncbi:MAG: hypothetical protein HY901_13600, partial [Deltaproteobacteria bacterium]|nr:hypothetical protein [Deltaproteobacteria bacterium]